MKSQGLLKIIQLRFIIMLVVCFQLVAPNKFINIPKVEALETAPVISISSPVSGTFLNDAVITIDGTAQNFGEGLSIELFNETEKINSPVEVVDGVWSAQVTLAEGTYSIHAVATDIDAKTASSSPITITVDFSPSEITFVKPTNGEFVNAPKLEGTAEENSTVDLCIDCTLDESGQATGTWKNVTADSSGMWMYEDSSLTDGIHSVYAKATDKSGNTGTTKGINFTLDTVRPKVSSIKVKYLDNESTSGLSEIDLLKSGDMSNVKRDTSISITITDEQKLKLFQKEEIGTLIMVYSSANASGAGEHVHGDATINYISENKFEIVFTPISLDASTTYYIFINPSLIDLSPGVPATTDTAGNPLFPLIKRITTERITDSKTLPPDQKMFHALDDPHGTFATNTNTCNTCHSTHVASNPKLEKAGFEYTTYNYCMACHDGTVAALPENMSQNGHFPQYNDTSVKKMATDCSTCHNPHLRWRAENPNLLDDHYIVENHPAIEGYSDDMFDSDKVLCETCHEHDSGIVKAYVTKDDNDPIKVSYKVLHYQKATATGITDDYALCFRCHNGNKPGIANIKSLYEDTGSKHRITAIDGGGLTKTTIPLADGTIPNDGHIPCAECHGTHGSDNSYIINNKIGHLDRRGFTVPANSPDDWTPSKEREFCIKCHNGSTAIYGVTGKDLLPRAGHDSVVDKDTPCSSCHGTGTTPEEKALSAAHAPK
jgi:predicted CXXCH cytochrome family protein